MNTVRRRRSHRRRSRKRLRSLLLLFAGLSLITSLILLPWAYLQGNPEMRRWGLVYLGGALLCLLGYLAAGGLNSHTRNHTPEPGLAPPPSGFALPVALLLMALLSGVVLHGLWSTQVVLRSARAHRDRTLLRLAAADAVWRTAQQLAAGGTRSPLAGVTREERLPSGISTRVMVREIERSRLPAPLVQTRTPVLGSTFTVLAQASGADTRSEVCAWLCRVPSGELRVLGWAERP